MRDGWMMWGMGALMAIALMPLAQADVKIPSFHTLKEYVEWLAQRDTLETLGMDRVVRSRRTPNCLIAVFQGEAKADQRHDVLDALAQRFLALTFKEEQTMVVFVEGHDGAGRILETVGRSVSGQSVVMGDACE